VAKPLLPWSFDRVVRVFENKHAKILISARALDFILSRREKEGRERKIARFPESRLKHPTRRKPATRLIASMEKKSGGIILYHNTSRGPPRQGLLPLNLLRAVSSHSRGFQSVGSPPNFQTHSGASVCGVQPPRGRCPSHVGDTVRGSRREAQLSLRLSLLFVLPFCLPSGVSGPQRLLNCDTSHKWPSHMSYKGKIFMVLVFREY
jgi:hypothetical protein